MVTSWGGDNVNKSFVHKSACSLSVAAVSPQRLMPLFCLSAILHYSSAGGKKKIGAQFKQHCSDKGGLQKSNKSLSC